MEAFLLEKVIAKTVIAPVNLGTAANTGSRVDMSKCKRVTFLVILAGGGTTAAHDFTLKQHTAASGGTTADLSVDNPYFHKVNAATYFTKVQPGSAAAAYDLHALIGDNAAIVAFEVLQDQLTDGYQWASLDIGDVGTTHLGCVLAICHDGYALPAYDKVV